MNTEHRASKTITFISQKKLEAHSVHKCYLGSECHELGMVLLVEVVEGLHVLAVGDGPVDGGEVFTLGKLLVQTPEHLDGARIS